MSADFYINNRPQLYNILSLFSNKLNPKFDNDNLPCWVTDFDINIRQLWSTIDKKSTEFNVNN